VPFSALSPKALLMSRFGSEVDILLSQIAKPSAASRCQRLCLDPCRPGRQRGGRAGCGRGAHTLCPPHAWQGPRS